MDIPLITKTQEEFEKTIPEGALAVNEIFHSIQGEGKHAGVPMVFIRTNLCRVFCSFCDTAYTWEKISHNAFYRPNELLAKIKKVSVNCNIVCITGGEPLEQLPALIKACEHLKNNNIRVHLETSGHYYIPKELTDVCDWVVCSPKRFNGLNFTAKINEIKKLVVAKERLDKFKEFVNGFKNNGNDVMVSIQPIEPTPPKTGNPDGLSEAELVIWREEVVQLRQTEQNEWEANKARAVDICLQTGWRLSLQLHKYLGVR